MTNFEVVSFKIVKEQYLKRLIYFRAISKSVMITFNYKNIFMRKHIIVNKIDDEKNPFVIKQKTKKNFKSLTNINNH